MLSRLLPMTVAFVALANALTIESRAAEPLPKVLPETPRIEPVNKSKPMCRLPSIFDCRPEPRYCHP